MISVIAPLVIQYKPAANICKLLVTSHQEVDLTYFELHTDVYIIVSIDLLKAGMIEMHDLRVIVSCLSVHCTWTASFQLSCALGGQREVSRRYHHGGIVRVRAVE